MYLLRGLVVETLLRGMEEPPRRPEGDLRARPSRSGFVSDWLAAAAFELSRGAAAGRIRASDAEREQVAAALQCHYTEGRLDHAELDARVGAAYRARTLAELERLVADLPAVPAPAPPPPRMARLARRTTAFAALALVGVLAVAALAILPEEVWALLIALSISLAAFALFAILPVALPIAAVVWVVRRAKQPAALRPAPWQPGVTAPRSRGAVVWRD